MIDIGENIREIRKLKGMTQKELGEKTGLTKDYIGALERGKMQNPSLQTMKKLSEALDTSIMDLFFSE